MNRRFEEAVAHALKEVPPGRVATCGVVARALGDVRAAVAVSGWIRDHPIEGSHRVVRADGRPICEGAAVRLRREQVPMKGGRVLSDLIVSALPEVGLLSALRDEQLRLESEVVEEDETEEFETIGAVDVAYQGDRAFAAAAVCDATSLNAVATASVQLEVDFPYIPTYLAFREFPPVREVLAELDVSPDVLLVDGHGRLHPAHFGFACYVGVKLGRLTIGVAKHPLGGHWRRSEVVDGGPVPIKLDGMIRGVVWAPSHGCRPLYISVGHRVSLPRAFSIVKACTRDRLPAPMRIADRLSKEGKKKREEKVGRGAP